MNVFDQLLSQLAASIRSEDQVTAATEVAFEAKAAFDREFGFGNRRSASITRLMLRLNQPTDRRTRVDTVYRIAELLEATSNDVRRSQGKPTSARGTEFFDSLPQPQTPDATA